MHPFTLECLLACWFGNLASIDPCSHVEFYIEFNRYNSVMKSNLCINTWEKLHNPQNLSIGQRLHILATQLLPHKFTSLSKTNLIGIMVRTTSSFLDMETTQEEIYRIRDLNKKFRLSCTQLVHINNLIEESEIRYNRSQAENRRSYRYILRLKLCTLEGVRNMFYEYAYAKADELEKMQLDLFSRTGIAWNDSLAEETDNEGSDGEEENMETDHSS